MHRVLLCLLCGLSAFLGSCSLLRNPPRQVQVKHEAQLTEGGVEILDITCGTGPAAELGDAVAIEYVGKLEDGTVFDDTEERGVPTRFVIGEAPLPGWDEGLIGMQFEGRRQLRVPPSLAYGDEGYPGLIPPAATLEFEVRLIDLESR